MNHIGDDAHLSALGMLDGEARERVDEHVRSCDACVRLVGRAERAVAAIADARPARASGVPRWTIAAVAASIIALAAALVLAFTLQRDVAADGRLLALLVDSHFAHVQFVSPRGVPLAAKAVYDRSGRWYAVVATAAADWHVVVITPDGSRQPISQAFARRGDAAVLMLDRWPPVRVLELDDGRGNLVGTARPVLGE